MLPRKGRIKSMGYNAFVGGVQPGGLTNDFEVKILICYLLDRLGTPMSFEQLNEILQSTGFVNYFEFASSISELERSGHILREEDAQGEAAYRLTPTGAATAKAFGKTLPRTVRERTLERARQEALLRQRLEEIEITHRPVPDGFMLDIRMKDVGSDLMNLSVFLPSQEDCAAIRDRVYADPTLLYRGVLSLLLGEYGEAAQLLAQQARQPDEKG